MEQGRAEGKGVTREVLLRKGVHSFGSLILVIATIYGTPAAQTVIAFMTALYLASEYLRLSGRSLPMFTWLTSLASSKTEQERVVDAPIWFALGVLITLTFFPFEHAVVGVLALTIGDPTASIVGLLMKDRHQIPFNTSKSMEGTIAGFCVSTIVCLLFVEPVTVILGCAGGMIAEALPLKLNDNFTVPIAAALTINILKTVLI
jgi:dolichol kinase